MFTSDGTTAAAALPAQELNGAEENKPRSRQLTVKGVDECTVKMTKDAARKRGLRLSSWIRMELQDAALRTLNEISPRSSVDQAVVERLLEQLQEIRRKQEAETYALEEIRSHLTNIIMIQHKLMSESLKHDE